MSRPEKEVFERLGTTGLSRVLDDVMDHGRLVRLANTCGLKYPGMRTQSQTRQRILSDLVSRASEQATSRRAIYRALRKETAPQQRKWSQLDGEQRNRRLTDSAYLLADGNLGRHLFFLATAENGAEGDEFDRLLGVASNGSAAAQPNTMTREESRLKKKCAELQKKLQHLETQLGRSRDDLKASKRDLIQRKGELAESRMLVERLRRELDEVRVRLERQTSRRKAPAPTQESVEEVTKSVRRLASEQRKLVHRLERLAEAPPARAALDDASLAAVHEPLATVQKDVAALRRDRKRDLHSRDVHLDELRKAVQATRKAAAKPQRRTRARGEAARVAVFIDVQNVYYAARQLKGKLDFDALLEAAVRDRRLIQATAYVVESKDTDQSGFISLLQQRAIEVRRKALKVRADGSMKGDWDMELALDILDAAPNLDVVVLVSGDGDFTSLVKRVKRMGPRVEVIGFPRATAKSLLESADDYQPLDRKFMIYPKRKTARRETTEAPDQAKGPAAAPVTKARAS